MKKYLFIIVISTLLVFQFGCQKPRVTPPYSAEVLTLLPRERDQRPGDDPRYQIKKVTFNFLEDIDTLSSKYFEVHSGHSLKISNRRFSSSERPDHSDIPRSPMLVYDVKGNVIIPKDNYTLSVLSTI